jgi:hypothetical protein
VGGPRFGSINVVVDDVPAAAGFLSDLGVELEPAPAEWERHHRSLPASGSEADADIDSPAFAAWWGGVPDESAPRCVVNVRVDGRDDVDRLYQHALDAGAVSLKAPFDAFWGARYAVVLAPGPLCLGVMSPPEQARRTAPPPISAFAPETSDPSGA